MFFLRKFLKTTVINVILSRVIKEVRKPENQKKAKKAYKNWKKGRK